MGNKGHSRKGLFGTVHHYDEHGKKTGHSRQGMFGYYNNYDSNGKKTGYSRPGFFGKYEHFDNNGKKMGHTRPGAFGSYVHYDKNGKNTGRSTAGLFENYNHSSEGCYIATCVYGSYDCPEVWTLRRYRDFNLAKTWYGRAFIRIYYAISPTVVRILGKTNLFKIFWRKRLDRMIKRLKTIGYESTPYNDREY